MVRGAAVQVRGTAGGARRRPLRARADAEKARTRFDTCQRQIDALAETFNRERPDLMVLIGDDQNELFVVDESVMPAFNVHTGASIDNAPDVDPKREELGLSEADWGHMPAQRISYPA